MFATDKAAERQGETVWMPPVKMDGWLEVSSRSRPIRSHRAHQDRHLTLQSVALLGAIATAVIAPIAYVWATLWTAS